MGNQTIRLTLIWTALVLIQVDSAHPYAHIQGSITGIGHGIALNLDPNLAAHCFKFRSLIDTGSSAIALVHCMALFQ
jgi:hypothetical protein